MATFEVDVGGVTYEVDAPDENTAWAWANQTHQSEAAAPVQQQAEEPFMESIGLSSNPMDYLRQVGLTARGALEGLGGSGPMFGLPQPQNETERMALAANRGAVGASAFGKGGQLLAKGVNTVAKRIGDVLAKAPVTNVAQGTASTVASQAAKESGGNELEQFGAGMAAPLALGSVGSLVRPIGRSIGNIVDTAVVKGGPTRAAGRAATVVAGDKAPQISGMLARTSADDPLTAGQATIGANKAEFQGLEKAAGAVDPSTFGRRHGSVTRGIDEFLKREGESLNRRVWPAADKILGDIESRGGLNATGVIQKLDSFLTNKTTSMNDATRGVVGHVLGKLKIASDAGHLDEATGMMNPRTLYEIRKRLGDEWRGLAAANNWDKKQASKAVRDIQSSIDDAIVAAGGKNWKQDYVEPFARGAKVLEEIRNAPKIASQMGIEGVKAARRTADFDMPEFSLPNLLNRPVMLVNAVIRRMRGAGEDKLQTELARLMRPESKQEMAKLIDEEMRRQMRRLSPKEELQKAALLASTVPGLGAPQSMDSGR